MCRITIIFLFSYISWVSSTLTIDTLNITSYCRLTSPVLNVSRIETLHCFKNIVQVYLHVEPKENETRICKTPCDFETTLNTHINNVKRECVPGLQIKSENFVDLVKFSLRDDGFKHYHSDLKNCVSKLKPNITECLRDNTGYTNKTQPKHTSWLSKNNMLYEEWHCDASKLVKKCTVKLLSACQNATREYVASLFDFSLKNCEGLNINASKFTGDGVSPPTKPESTLGTVAIVLGSMIAVGIIIIVVVKNKDKIRC